MIEFYNVKKKKKVQIDESNVEIEKSTIRGLFLSFYDSKVNIYNSIIYYYISKIKTKKWSE